MAAMLKKNILYLHRIHLSLMEDRRTAIKAASDTCAEIAERRTHDAQSKIRVTLNLRSAAKYEGQIRIEAPFVKLIEEHN
eukprot:CAMPEP_0179288206 /NCGR_PEP_ID=MMETSP0797-20121207/40664_1 /TAXON_ID=47934 /ORGANISM="Dinophysis acuminata, Strain DAEP01" /LENGTH=79 /DNA_ID=CAMNT_0020997167 /DNA_START=574 /DNA_END=810 /DNA_ORIENTATION=-